jgi:putative addiction module component (TIGR02574 family)
MPSEPTDLLSSALSLPVRERAKIAHELLASLDGGADADAASAWVAELEQRANEVHHGSTPTEPWEAVRVRLVERWRHR